MLCAAAAVEAAAAHKEKYSQPVSTSKCHAQSDALRKVRVKCEPRSARPVEQSKKVSDVCIRKIYETMWKIDAAQVLTGRANCVVHISS